MFQIDIKLIKDKNVFFRSVEVSRGILDYIFVTSSDTKH